LLICILVVDTLHVTAFKPIFKIFLFTLQMGDVDPETLLEWLSMGQGDERDMQLIALEQLCMLLLMSDNVDRCFERYLIVTPIVELTFERSFSYPSLQLSSSNIFTSTV